MGGIEIDPIFVYGNYAEAVLWAMLGVSAFVWRNSSAGIILGITLLAFGASDVVEAQTGAWYEPWWLLIWKAICVLAILISGRSVYRVGKLKWCVPANDREGEAPAEPERQHA